MPTDATSLLCADHRELERLFGEFQRCPDAAGQQRLCQQVAVALAQHGNAEEGHLYPAVRERVPGGEELAEQMADEHRQVEHVLRALERFDADNPEFQALMHHLIWLVRRHVHAEEQQVLPRLAAVLSEAELVELGGKLATLERVGPTRPHPHLPDDAASSRLLAPAAGLLDRIRDRAGRRRPARS